MISMELSSGDLQRIARLSKMELSDEDVVEFLHDVNHILDYFSAIRSVNDIRESSVAGSGELRKDILQGSFDCSAHIRENFPVKNKGFLIVQRGL